MTKRASSITRGEDRVDNTLKYHLENIVPRRGTIKVINTQELCTVECQNQDCKETWLVEREEFTNIKTPSYYICPKCEYGKTAYVAKRARKSNS